MLTNRINSARYPSLSSPLPLLARSIIALISVSRINSKFNTGETMILFSDQNETTSNKIPQIVLIKSPLHINDSVTKLLAEIHFSDKTKDTIISYIKTSTIKYKGSILKASEITFEKHIPVSQ